MGGSCLEALRRTVLREEGSQSEEKAAALSPALAFQRQRVNGTAIIFNYLVLGRGYLVQQS